METSSTAVNVQAGAWVFCDGRLLQSIEPGSKEPRQFALLSGASLHRLSNGCLNHEITSTAMVKGRGALILLAMAMQLS